MRTKKRVKFLIYGVIMGIVCLTAALRIIYINTVKYPLTAPRVYKIGDEVNYQGFQIRIIDVKIFSAKELAEKYSDLQVDDADESNVIVKVEITNNFDEDERLELGGIVMMYDYLYGGSMNPYLFSVINSNVETLRIASREQLNVELTYPLIGENPSLIFSLYPQKIAVQLF